MSTKQEELARNQTYMEQFEDIVKYNWVSEIPEKYQSESIRYLQINFVGFMKLTNDFYKLNDKIRYLHSNSS